jgi:hypothetical protein
MRVILETMTGQKRVIDACDELDICEQFFERLRAQAIQAAIERLEPKPAGRRPAHATDEERQIAALTKRIAELEAELHAARVRAEMAATLPGVGSAKKR